MSRRAISEVADLPLSNDDPLVALGATLPELHAALGCAMEAGVQDVASYLRERIARMEREAAARRWPPQAEGAAALVRRVRERARKK